MNYDINHFINKFTAIDDDQWCVGKNVDSDGRRCALGWCMMNLIGKPFQLFIGNEYINLNYLAHTHLNTDMSMINDGKDKRYKQSHPKARVLAALKDCLKA